MFWFCKTYGWKKKNKERLDIKQLTLVEKKTASTTKFIKDTRAKMENFKCKDWILATFKKAFLSAEGIFPNVATILQLAFNVSSDLNSRAIVWGFFSLMNFSNEWLRMLN